MAHESWESVVQMKQAEATAKIPADWRLSAEYTNISEIKQTSVLDVPRRYGLLSAK